MSAYFAGLALWIVAFLVLNGDYPEAAGVSVAAVVLALLNIADAIRDGHRQQASRDRRAERSGR